MQCNKKFYKEQDYPDGRGFGGRKTTNIQNCGFAPPKKKPPQ